MQAGLGLATVAEPGAGFHEGFEPCDFTDGDEALFFGGKHPHFLIERWQKHPLDAKIDMGEQFHR